MSGATLDIAIWSTVEQGLGITAGSLAALRPLFQLLIHKYGIATSRNKKDTSNYGQATPVANEGLGSRHKLSPDDLDMYKLSVLVETIHSKRESLQENTNLHMPPFRSSHIPDSPFQHLKEYSSQPEWVYSSSPHHMSIEMRSDLTNDNKNDNEGELNMRGNSSGSSSNSMF